MLAWPCVTNVPLLLVILASLALAGGVLNTVISSAITKSVYPLDRNIVQLTLL